MSNPATGWAKQLFAVNSGSSSSHSITFKIYGSEEMRRCSCFFSFSPFSGRFIRWNSFNIQHDYVLAFEQTAPFNAFNRPRLTVTDGFIIYTPPPPAPHTHTHPTGNQLRERKTLEAFQTAALSIFTAEAPHCLRGLKIKRERLERPKNRGLTSNALVLFVFFSDSLSVHHWPLLGFRLIWHQIFRSILLLLILMDGMNSGNFRIRGLLTVDLHANLIWKMSLLFISHDKLLSNDLLCYGLILRPLRPRLSLPSETSELFVDENPVSPPLASTTTGWIVMAGNMCKQKNNCLQNTKNMFLDSFQFASEKIKKALTNEVFSNAF